MTPNRPAPIGRPLVVVEGPMGMLGSQVATALAAARRGGWEIVRAWTPPARPGRFVCTGAVRTPDDAGLAVRAVARGAGLVVAASAAGVTIDRLLADLRRHGSVQHLRDGPLDGRSRLTEAERALLGLLAEGLTIDEAARELGMGARAARRRLAAARRHIGSGSPSAALAAELGSRS